MEHPDAKYMTIKTPGEHMKNKQNFNVSPVNEREEKKHREGKVGQRGLRKGPRWAMAQHNENRPQEGEMVK